MSRVQIQLTTEATHRLESQEQALSIGSKCSSLWKLLTVTDWRALGLGPMFSLDRGCVAVWGVVKVVIRIKERGAMYLVVAQACVDCCRAGAVWLHLVWGLCVHFVIEVEAPG